MNLTDHFRLRIAELPLGACITAAVTDAVCAGFILDDVSIYNFPVIFLTALLMQALLMWFAHDSLWKKIGILTGVIAMIAAIFYGSAVDPLTDEAENGPVIFIMTEIIAAVLQFLLTRIRPGTIALFIAGVIISAGSHFLQFPVSVWALVLFVIAVPIMYMYRVYMVSLEKADIGNVRMGSYMGQTTAVCLVCVLFGGTIFYGVLAPLNLPTQELLLIRIFESMDVFKVLGVYTTHHVLDPSMTSDADTERRDEAENPGDEENDSMEERQQERNDNVLDNITTQIQNLMSVRYDFFNFNMLWLLLLIPAAIAAVYTARYMLKQRWRKRVKELSPEDAVINYYNYFIRRFERIGYKRGSSRTLHEYASDMKTQLENFENEDSSFEALTDIYERVLYGRASVNEEEYGLFERFYESFYPALRREVGTVKYYLTAFRY